MFYDFIISGGGLSGCLAACMLKKLDYSFFVLEKKTSSTKDARTSTISKTSAEFLDEIGIWHNLKEHATPILDIYTYESGCASYLHFQNKMECKKNPMGFVLPNTLLKSELENGLKIHFNKPYKKIETSCQKVRTYFDEEEHLDSRFLIAAEGRDSGLVKKHNLIALDRNYKQACIVCNLISSEEEHKNIAREIFLPSGPVALLPLKLANHFSLIWTVNFCIADQIKNLEESEFLKQISKITGINFTGILTKRVCYPIKLHLAHKYFKKNIIFLGDSMHAIHPVAGQAFNLTIYDLKSLYNLLSVYGIDRLSSLLDSYQRERFRKNVKMAAFTDLLVKGFSNNSFVIKLLRNLSLDFINSNKSVKNFFISRAMGKTF